MAWVSKIEFEEGNGRMQPSKVTARIKRFYLDGQTSVLQIDTHGSEDRENPGKQSHTLQFGRESAQELFDGLKNAFNFR